MTMGADSTLSFHCGWGYPIGEPISPFQVNFIDGIVSDEVLGT